MRQLFFLLALLATGMAQAQKIADPKPFANTITEDDLKKHLYTLAGKEYEGRETATEGQRKAAAYIENHFKSLGLQPGNNGSYQMFYPVFRDSLESAAIQVNDKQFSLNEDFAV
ncbi:MAG: peptidase M28, partial [Bacteroidetes bacterium]|nr:peptidase M28 [Bacteroidota bacterium]